MGWGWRARSPPALPSPGSTHMSTSTPSSCWARSRPNTLGDKLAFGAGATAWLPFYSSFRSATARGFCGRVRQARRLADARRPDRHDDVRSGVEASWHRTGPARKYRRCVSQIHCRCLLRAIWRLILRSMLSAGGMSSKTAGAWTWFVPPRPLHSASSLSR